MRKIKLRLTALLSLFLCVVVCLTAAFSLLFVSAKRTANAEERDGFKLLSETDLFNDETNQIDKTVLKQLYTALGGSSVDSYAALLSYYEDGADKTSADIRKNNGNLNLSVKFGGKKWDAVDLEKTRSGDLVLTLWQSADDITETSKFANRESSSYTPTEEYPDNMYSTSFVRVQTLNAGGYMSTSGTTLGDLTPQNPSNKYARFTMSDMDNSLVSFIVQPKDIAYQETENNNGNSSALFSLVNDAYGKDTSAYDGTVNFYSDDYKNYVNKDKYDDWKNDYLWLPSLAETGNNDSENQNGLWKTNDKLRSTASSSSAAWLRSGCANSAGSASRLNGSGSNSDFSVFDLSLVRPAIHLNLTLAEKSAQRADSFTQIGSASNDLYNDDTGIFDYDLLQQLYKSVAGANSYAELAAASVAGKTSADIREYNGGKNLSVWFGGKKWDIVHLTTTRDGEPIVTLWQSADNISGTPSKWANRGFNNYSDDASVEYPDNMYSTSLVRVKTLNAGGQMSTYGSALGDVIPQDINNPYARFTMSGADKSLVNYIVQPKDIAYQETENAKDTCYIDYTLPNDAYGTPVGANWYNGNDYTTKDKYGDWQNDYLWLPSLAEIGDSDYENQNGLWRTDTALRSVVKKNNSIRTWLRSGNWQYAYSAFYLTESGGSYGSSGYDEYPVRPALHLNLTAAAKSAGIDVPVAKAAEKNYTGEDITFNLDKYSETFVKLDKVEKDGVDYRDYTFTEATGEFKVKKAGVYTLTFTPKDGEWKDGGSGEKTVQFTVKKESLKVNFDSDFGLSQDYTYHLEKQYSVALPQDKISGVTELSGENLQIKYIVETHGLSKQDHEDYMNSHKTLPEAGDPRWQTAESVPDYPNLKLSEPQGYCIYYMVSADNYETLIGRYSVHIYNEMLTITSEHTFESKTYGELSITQTALRTAVFENITDISATAEDVSSSQPDEEYNLEYFKLHQDLFTFYFKKSGEDFEVEDSAVGTDWAVGEYELYVKFSSPDNGTHIHFKWVNSEKAEARPKLEITKKIIELTVESKGHTYGQQPATVGIVTPDVGVFANGESVDVLGTILYTYKDSEGAPAELSSTLKAGTYTVSAKLQSEEGLNYAVTFKDGQYTVSAATVKKPSGTDISDVTYKGADYELTVSDYDGSTMKYTTDGEGAAFDPASGKFTAKNAGESTLTISLKDEDNYTWEGGGTDPVILKITIGKATIDSSEFTYDGGNRAWSGSGQTVSVTDYPEDKLTYTVNYYKSENGGKGEKLPSAPVDEGEYIAEVEFTLTGEAVGNYEEVAKHEVTLKITKSISAPTAPDKEYTYNGEQQEFVFDEGTFDGETMELEYGYDDGSWHSLGAQAPIEAGDYKVKVRTRDENVIFTSNNGREIEFEFKIKPADIVLLNENGNSWIEVTGEADNKYVVTIAEKDESGKFTNFDVVGGQDIRIFATAPQKYTDAADKPQKPPFTMPQGRAESAYKEITSLNLNDNDSEFAIDIGSTGKYVIYYYVVAPNHTDLDGEWRVEVKKVDEYVKVLFKQPYEVEYGEEITAEDVFEDLKTNSGQYLDISLGGEPLAAETFFGQVTGVTLGNRRVNKFGKYCDSGEYYINFTLKPDSIYSVIYREGGNDPAADTNLDKLKITQIPLSISWNKLTYEISDGQSIELTSLTELATLDTSNMAQDGGPVSVRFELADHTQVITAEGEYQVTAVLESANAKNYRFADSATVTNTIVVTAAVQSDVSEQPSENQPQTPPATSEDKDGIPWWVWLIVGIGAALIVAAIIILIVVMKRRKPEKEVVIRDINSDDDGFYDEVTEDKDDDGKK